MLARARQAAPLLAVKTIIGPVGDIAVDIIHDIVVCPLAAHDMFMIQTLPQPQ